MKKREALFCVLVTLLFCGQASAATYPATTRVQLMMYDFHSDGSNPEFEPAMKPSNQVQLSMVAPTLDAGGLPALGSILFFNSDIKYWFRPWNLPGGGMGDQMRPKYDSAGHLSGIVNAGTDTSFKNSVIRDSISFALADSTTGTYTFASDSFFPVDNWISDKEGLAHNYSFTAVVRHRIACLPGRAISITGSGDIWVFVNNKLVIDLGGFHGAATGSVSMSAIAGLVVGQTYEAAIFYAQRKSPSSVLHITMNLVDSAITATVAPGPFSYDMTECWYVTGMQIPPNKVHRTGSESIDSFTISRPLPAGLSMDKHTGTISGTAISETMQMPYYVRAVNSAGFYAETLSIGIIQSWPSVSTFQGTVIDSFFDAMLYPGVPKVPVKSCTVYVYITDTLYGVNETYFGLTDDAGKYKVSIPLLSAAYWFDSISAHYGANPPVTRALIPMLPGQSETLGIDLPGYPIVPPSSVVALGPGARAGGVHLFEDGGALCVDAAIGQRISVNVFDLTGRELRPLRYEGVVPAGATRLPGSWKSCSGFVVVRIQSKAGLQAERVLMR
jgi:fibro-slime domain-containing protein